MAEEAAEASAIIVHLPLGVITASLVKEPRVAGESGVWSSDRYFDQYEDEARWRELLRHTAKFEVPFCAMVAWADYGRGPSGLSRKIPQSVAQNTKLVQIYHQAAGTACWHLRIEGFPFELNSWGDAHARNLVIEYWGSDLHFLPERPMDYYRKRMKPLTTECLTRPYPAPLCEAFYPFDLNDKNLALVAADPDAVRRQLAALNDWADLAKVMLCIVAENSD